MPQTPYTQQQAAGLAEASDLLSVSVACCYLVVDCATSRLAGVVFLLVVTDPLHNNPQTAWTTAFWLRRALATADGLWLIPQAAWLGGRLVARLVAIFFYTLFKAAYETVSEKARNSIFEAG